jgi:hypothetical protein
MLIIDERLWSDCDCVFPVATYSYLQRGINYFGLFQPAKNSAKAKSRNITITIIATIILMFFYSF